MENKDKFKIRLKTLRKEKGLTQKDLSGKLGIVRTAVANYETGRTTPDSQTLLIMANVLETTTDYLLGRTDNPKYKLAQLTPELQELGVEYIALAKEFKDNKIPPEDVRKILEAVKNIRNN